MTVVTYVVFGFLKGFQPFAGYNYGAQKYDRLQKSLILSTLWSTVFCVIAGVVLILFAAPIVSLFGSDTNMVSLAGLALKLNAIFFMTFGFQMVYASLYLAIGKSLVGGLLSLSRQGVFFLPLIAILPRLFGLAGVIWVQPAADLLTTLVTVIFAVKITRELKQMTLPTQQMMQSTSFEP